MHVDIKQIQDRFSGEEYLDFYDKYRPSAPQALVNSSLQYARVKHAGLIVDIGSGTGLSTFIWKNCATSIIGVDPSADMRRLAESHLDQTMSHISFIHGTGQEVEVEDASVDIVSCGQVFHWMETEKALREVHRILRPGGVFVVYDCAWPPIFHPDLESAYRNLFVRIDQIAKGYNSEIVIGHMKQKHFENIDGSGYFDSVHASDYNKTETGSLERFEGILLSQGGVHALLREGFTEEEIGLAQFKKSIRMVQDVPDQMTFHFKSIFAVK